MYEVYQDHPKQARLNIRVVLAVAFLVCAIGAGIFLITRLVSKPLTKEEARAKAGIVYDSAAVEGGWDNLSPEEIAEKLNEKVAEGMPDYNADRMYASAEENGTEYGTMDTMPDIVGLGLWKKGHWGVYVGNGYAIEAMGTQYGVVRTQVEGRGWQGWCKIPYIQYDE